MLVSLASAAELFKIDIRAMINSNCDSESPWKIFHLILTVPIASPFAIAWYSKGYYDNWHDGKALRGAVTLFVGLVVIVVIVVVMVVVNFIFFLILFE